MVINLLGILFVMYVIWKASDGFEAASNFLGRNMSDGVKGATINAIGSSLPELMTAMIALLWYNDRDGFGFGVAATAGSALFNTFIIPSAVILSVVLLTNVKKIRISKKVVLRDGLFLLFAEFLLIVLLTGGTITFVHGLIMLLTYLLYVSYTLMSMQKDANHHSDNSEFLEYDIDRSRWMSVIHIDLRHLFLGKRELTTSNSITLLIGSIAVIGIACHFLVGFTYSIGDALNLNVFFISVILAAAATSIPDTILSMKDAQNGNYDDATSNALGSNIFDVLVSLGLPVVIYTMISGPIVIEAHSAQLISELRIYLFILTVVAFVFLLFSKHLSFWSGLFLVGVYLLFVLYIYGKAYELEYAKAISEYLMIISHHIPHFI
jgi:cation:H+ antiporter